ncbi:MAG: hypothetical protein EOO10_02510 [Chitinophagaceae bacterium]|nr:MAG: hypothetical protein EOO10_02510 [Chitinophagaceae bacterium]
MFRIAFTVSILLNLSSQAQSGIDYLKTMYTKNAGHWYNTMTFVQTTGFYRNDSLIRTATWYEALKLPHDLRIDFEDPSKGNFVLYKKDSTYRFQNGNLRNVSADINPFIFFIGGMYYLPFDSVLSQLKSKGYDVQKGYSTTWNGKKTFVIGRENEQDLSNAFWLDTERGLILRLVEKNNRGQVIDAHMKDHKKLPKGSSETKVDIYVNGKLVQVESYDQIKIDRPLDDQLFDPAKAGNVAHWYKG